MPHTLDCEGQISPSPLPSPAGIKARFLPAALIKARAEAMSPRNCMDLTRIAKQALYGILAFLDVKHPCNPVFASRENICAEALLGSQPTLYRALAELVSKGYIRREQARRLGSTTYGQYTVSRIWVEEKALLLLGIIRAAKAPSPTLDKEDDDKPSGDVYSQGPSINKIDRLLMSEPTPGKQLSTKGQPQQGRRDNNKGERAGESLQPAIDRKTGLPAELLPLLELGVSKARVCLLMAKARCHGNGGKLGIILKLVWPYVNQLRGRAVFAYLAKMVEQKKDFGKVLANAEQEVRDEEDRARRTEKLSVFLDRAEGATLVNRAGKVVGQVCRLSKDSGYVDVLDTSGAAPVRRATPINLRIIEQWEEGDVVIRRAGQAVFCG